jgi:glutathionylspermidine synthase
MMREKFGPHVPAASTRLIEPLWKSVLSCKALLPLLWELFPDHPNLLPAYFDASRLESFARKPPPRFDGFHPVIGSWIVGNEPAGMCIREDRSLISSDTSHFVPHYIPWGPHRDAIRRLVPRLLRGGDRAAAGVRRLRAGDRGEYQRVAAPLMG